MSALLGRPIQQRFDALEKANRVRTLRAEAKRAIKTDPALILEWLDQTPDWLETAKAYQMVCAIPRIGATKANRWFASHGVSFTKTMGGLSDRQRAALIGELGLFLAGRSLPTRNRPIVRGRVPVARVCRECGALLRRPSPDGRCGFCIEQEKAA